LKPAQVELFVHIIHNNITYVGVYRTDYGKQRSRSKEYLFIDKNTSPLLYTLHSTSVGGAFQMVHNSEKIDAAGVLKAK